MQSKIIKTLFISICLIFFSAIGLIIWENTGERRALSRNYPELEEKISPEVFKANIILLPSRTDTHDNVTSFSYGTPASGFIFSIEGDTCYALTSCHAFDADFDTWLVLNYEQHTYIKTENSGSGLIEYYKQFPSATIEYRDETADVAIIRFTSKEKLNALPLAKKDVSKRDKIAVISTPEGYGRDLVTYGKVQATGKKISADSVERENVFLHSAFIYNGSSGSVVLNSDMEICGMNIASANFLLTGKFRNSAAVPAKTLQQVLDAWQSAN